MDNTTNKRIAKKRRFMSLVMLAIAIAMCVSPAVAYAVTRTNTTVGANSQITASATRTTATSRPTGHATATTTNANSNGIRANVILRGRHANGNSYAVDSGWRAVIGEGGRMLPRNTSARTATLQATHTNGLYTGEGQRRASVSSAWATSGTIRTVQTGWP